MNPGKATGLGEPEPVGKKSLFQPPAAIHQPEVKTEKTSTPMLGPRLRMTLEVTRQSLQIIQEVQSRYRLENGHALPKWRIISDALVLYDKQKKRKGSEEE